MKNGERTVAARIAQFEMTGSKLIAKDSSPTDEQENRQNITPPPYHSMTLMPFLKVWGWFNDWCDWLTLLYCEMKRSIYRCIMVNNTPASCTLLPANQEQLTRKIYILSFPSWEGFLWRVGGGHIEINRRRRSNLCVNTGTTLWPSSPYNFDFTHK